MISRLHEIEQREGSGRFNTVHLPTQLRLPSLLEQLRDLRLPPPPKRTLLAAWRAGFSKRRR